MKGSKHTIGDLMQMQSLPLDIKVKMTQRRIREFYDHFDGQVCLSFSGGKDSTVLKHIIDNMYDDVPSVFCNTGLEYPEIQKFAMNSPNTITVRPKRSFREIIEGYGYPVISKEVSKNVYYARKDGEDSLYYQKLFGTLMYKGEKSMLCSDKWKFLYDAPFPISHWCCKFLKKQPMITFQNKNKLYPLLATMASESRLRTSAWLMTGCNVFEGDAKSTPMAFWTDQDVLRYIVKYDVEICSVYGDIVPKRDIEGQMDFMDMCEGCEDTYETTGADRTGCIFCMFGVHLDKKPNRFQRLKETHPKQYDYCINGGEMRDGQWLPNKKGLGLGKVLDYIGVEY